MYIVYNGKYGFFIEIKYVPASFLVAVEVRVLGALLGAGPAEPAHARDVILQKLYKKYSHIQHLLYRSLLRGAHAPNIILQKLFQASIRTFIISFTEAFLLRGAHARDIMLQKLFEVNIRAFIKLFTEAF
jgi:hypothetical protein